MKMGQEERMETWLDRIETERVKGRVSGEHREERVSYTALQDSRLFILQASQGKS